MFWEGAVMAGVDISTASSFASQTADAGRGKDVRPEKVAEDSQIRVDSMVIEAELNIERVSEAIELTAETISPERLADLVEKLREAMPATKNSLQFRIDEVLDRPVVSVIDEKSGKIIRQLPSDEVVRAAHNIEYMRGVLFDERS